MAASSEPGNFSYGTPADPTGFSSSTPAGTDTGGLVGATSTNSLGGIFSSGSTSALQTLSIVITNILSDNKKIAFEPYGVQFTLSDGSTGYSALHYATAIELGGLGALTDVVITGTPSDNQPLAYNNATSKWINQKLAFDGIDPAAILDSDTMSGASSTTLATSESIKAYVDAHPGDITEVIAGTGLTGGGASGSVTLNAVGTSNRISVSADAIDIDSSYVGQNTITTLGTITTGVWNGTAIANSNLANSSVNYGGVTLALGASDTTPAFDLADATNYPTSSLTGTITNAQLAGSIANAKLSNSTVSYGGVSLALGASDATPAFDLTDATNYPTSSLSGTITNAQLAGSIANAKLANSTVSYGGISLALGASDATPAFDLADATNYPTSSLSGTITNAQLAGSIANAKLANSSITVSDGSSSTATALGGTITFEGTTNEVEVGEASGTITVGLPNNVTIAGDLTVNGSTTTVNTATLSVEDPLIKLANGNNAADSVDIGFYGLYDTSGSQDLYAGLFRDANDSGKFKLFKDLQVEPDTTVNTGGTGYATGTLVANLEGNVTGNASGTAATVTGATQSSITSVGTLTGLTIDGDVTFTGDNYNVVWDKSDNALEFADSAKLTFGAGGDLEIYHHAGSSTTYMQNYYGDLSIKIRQADKKFIVKGDDSNGGGSSTVDYVVADGSTGEVQLYHYGSEKLATKSTGIDVTGETETDTLRITSTTDASNASTGHGFQIGATNSTNIIMDNNEILSRNNGATSTLYVQAEGGTTEFGGHVYLNPDKWIVFEGATSDGYETFLTVTDPTADRTITFPDATGTVALTSDISGYAPLAGATFTGDVTFTGDNYNVLWDKSDNALEFGDDAKLTFGGNLEIYTQSNDYSVIRQVDGQHLYIYNSADDKGVYIKADNGSGAVVDYLVARGDTGEALLYHYGSEKLATKSTGVDVTGVLTTDGATHDGDVTFTGDNYNVLWDKSDNALKFADHAKIKIGTGDDLEISHNGNNSFITDTGTGSLYIQGTNSIFLRNNPGTKTYIQATNGGSVDIYYNNSKKFETTNTGVDVTGNLTVTSTDAGSGSDPKLYLYRNSSSPADWDYLGATVFQGENSAGEVIDYASLIGRIEDATDGTEDGRIEIYQMQNSSSVQTYGFAPSLFQFINEQNIQWYQHGGTLYDVTLSAATPSADRTITLPDATGEVVLSSGSIDTDSSAEIGRAHIGHVGFNDFAGFRHVDVEANGGYALLQSTGGGTFVNAATGQLVRLRNNNADVAHIDSTGLYLYDGKVLTFEGATDNNFETTLTVTDSTADRTITLPDATGTVLLNAGNQTLTGDLTFPDSEEIKLGTGEDLRIFHDGTNNIFRGASNPTYIQTDNTIFLTKNANSETMAKFIGDGAVELYHDNVKKLETTSTGIALSSTDDGASAEPIIELYRHSASPAANDVLGSVDFYAEDDNDDKVKYAAMQGAIFHPTEGNERGFMYLQVMQNGSMANFQRMGANGIIMYKSVTMNTGFHLEGTNCTFRRVAEGRAKIEENEIITTANANIPTTTTSSSDADHVLIDDGGVLKKITPGNLGIGGGGGGTGAMVHLNTSTISSSTSEFDIDSTHINSTYNIYRIYYYFKPSTDAYLYSRFFVGGSIVSQSRPYGYQSYDWYYETADDDESYIKMTYQLIGDGGTFGTDGEGISGWLELKDVNNTDFPCGITGQANIWRNDDHWINQTSGAFLQDKEDDVVNGIRFYFSSGDIEKGKVQIYGISD